MTPALNTAAAVAYVDINQGISYDLDDSAAHSVDENVGIEPLVIPAAVHSVDENVGVNITLVPDAVEYVALGDVDESQPQPHIWFLRPTSGRAGDGIEIVGGGFGDLQSTHSGAVEFKPDPESDQWAPVPVTSWQTFPPTEHAYTSDRVLDQETGRIDQQHTVIGMTIGSTMVPPGYPVRVRTEED